jgi:hypothetical protein
MEFWIIGFGQAGRRAFKRLRRRRPDARFAIVDPLLCDQPEGLEYVHWLREDGLAFMYEHRLEIAAEPSPWIVPALPRHLAYDWIYTLLEETFAVQAKPVPATLVAQLPNAVTGSEGQAYISNADFICPENCNEPTAGCPVTRRSRHFDLHVRLADIRVEGVRSVVIRSHQLAPGVGGYRGRQLEDALQAIKASPGSYLLSTASKCHGVMHAFSTADQRSRDKEQS